MKRINVLGHKVNIREVDIDDFEFGGLGQITVSSSQMLVNKNVSPDLKENTILHESLHYASELLAIGLTEPQVTQLGLFFRTFIMENKQFIREMIK